MSVVVKSRCCAGSLCTERGASSTTSLGSSTTGSSTTCSWRHSPRGAGEAVVIKGLGWFAFLEAWNLIGAFYFAANSSTYNTMTHTATGMFHADLSAHAMHG